MKKNIAILILLISAVPVLSQEGGFQSVADVELIAQLADKPTASFGDAVTMFSMLYAERRKDVAANVSLLQSKGIIGTSSPTTINPLRRGALALMAARYLKLDDSLFYAVIGTGRYAVKACIANEIMEYTGGEWDILSGGELVEIMRKVAEKSGGNK